MLVLASSHLLTVERLHEVLVENEELKAALAATESSKHQLKKELDALERDHHALVKEKESLTDEVHISRIRTHMVFY